MSAIQRFRIDVWLFTLLAFSGCSHFKPPEPTDRTAVVRAGAWGKVYRGGYVGIETINGAPSSRRLHADVEVAPGEQLVVAEVYLCQEDSQHCTGIAQTQIAFSAQARHAYRLHAQEQVNGSNHFWVWIEDDVTGGVVGGTPPRPAS